MRSRPGLQPERTVAAWTRTCAALIVNALVLARAGLGSHGTPHNFVLLGVGAGVGVSAIVLFSLLSKRHRALLSAKRFAPAVPEIGLVSLLTVIIGISATYAIFS